METSRASVTDGVNKLSDAYRISRMRSFGT